MRGIPNRLPGGRWTIAALAASLAALTTAGAGRGHEREPGGSFPATGIDWPRYWNWDRDFPEEYDVPAIPRPRSTTTSTMSSMSVTPPARPLELEYASPSSPGVPMDRPPAPGFGRSRPIAVVPVDRFADAAPPRDWGTPGWSRPLDLSGPLPEVAPPIPFGSADKEASNSIVPERLPAIPNESKTRSSGPFSALLNAPGGWTAGVGSQRALDDAAIRVSTSVPPNSRVTELSAPHPDFGIPYRPTSASIPPAVAGNGDRKAESGSGRGWIGNWPRPRFGSANGGGSESIAGFLENRFRGFRFPGLPWSPPPIHLW